VQVPSQLTVTLHKNKKKRKKKKGCSYRIYVYNYRGSRSKWPCGLRLRSAAERLLGSWVRIPPGAWMFVSCAVFVVSGRGLCDGPIPRSEESYRLWCVSECDQVNINNLDTYCE
jgi:hypothetical protein